MAVSKQTPAPAATAPAAPTAAVCRTVLYQLNEWDAEQINRRRAVAAAAPAQAWGFQTHVGNHAEAGQSFPAVVVRVFGTGGSVNLQVLLDGADTYWATSRSEGGEPGTWSWPPRS